MFFLETTNVRQYLLVMLYAYFPYHTEYLKRYVLKSEGLKFTLFTAS